MKDGGKLDARGRARTRFVGRHLAVNHALNRDKLGSGGNANTPPSRPCAGGALIERHNAAPPQPPSRTASLPASTKLANAAIMVPVLAKRSSARWRLLTSSL
jgi:hypothetical protein